MHVVAGYVRVVGYLNRKGWYTRPKAEPTKAQRERHNIAMTTLDGREVWTVDPKEGSARLTMVYLHGGAYVAPISRRHWPLFAYLVDNAEVRIVAPLYGLAPSASYKDAYVFLSSVIQGLISAGTDPRAIVLAGDSAGGGLALGMAHHLRDNGVKIAGMVLIAPWIDLAMNSAEVKKAEARDPWLRVDGLRACAELWANGSDLDDPALSPINAPQHDLPRTLVLCGDRDLFLPDNQAFADEARADGSDVTLIESAGSLHVYPLLPTPEGKQGKKDIATFVRGL
jgi:epsilon-lactone hydrolase